MTNVSGSLVCPIFRVLGKTTAEAFNYIDFCLTAVIYRLVQYLTLAVVLWHCQ
jgi:hypothetical protein